MKKGYNNPSESKSGFGASRFNLNGPSKILILHYFHSLTRPSIDVFQLGTLHSKGLILIK